MIRLIFMFYYQQNELVITSFPIISNHRRNTIVIFLNFKFKLDILNGIHCFYLHE